MTDGLKAAVGQAREAGLEGLFCGVCDGSQFVELDNPWEHYKAACPACEGTGYPSAAEVLMWVVMRQLSRECRVTIGARSVWVDDGGFDYHDGTPNRLAAEALAAVMLRSDSSGANP